MILWEILVVILLIFLNAFFAMSEMAMVSARRLRLQALADEGHKGAKVAVMLVTDPSRFLSTVQFGITLIGILAGAYGGATIAEHFALYLNSFSFINPHGDAIAIGIVVMCITYFSLVVGELVPKRIALNHAETIAVWVARPMHILSIVGKPVVWLLGISTEAVIRVFGITGVRDTSVTEEEVKTLIAEGTQAGIFDPAEKLMIDGVLRLADRPSRAIMTPRPDIIWLDIDDPIETIRSEIIDTGHARFLVSQGHLDDLLGIVETKDLLDRLLRGETLDLRAAIQKPLVIHEGVRVLRLLELFKQSPVKMAAVVDEYGSIEGIVTLTDVLSAITGDVTESTHDDEQQAVQREDGSWLMDAMSSIDDVESRIGLKGMRGDGEYHTLAGFLLAQMGHVPSVSEYIIWQGVRFEVVDMDGQRIDKILIVLPAIPAPTATHSSISPSN